MNLEKVCDDANDNMSIKYQNGRAMNRKKWIQNRVMYKKIEYIKEMILNKTKKWIEYNKKELNWI